RVAAPEHGARAAGAAEERAALPMLGGLPTPDGTAIAAPPQAPDAAPPRPAFPLPVRQVAQIALALAAGGEDEDRLSLVLEPAELGRVEVSIERSGATAQIRVTAERPETLLLLQRDARELDRLLGQAGIGDEGRALSFGLAADTGGGGDRRDGGGHRAGGHAAASPLANPDAPPRAPLGLLDIAV
ncbi:MAG TPA: flagellar hook-length control protein FliK, partial [Acetobacteraceae bacterium]|nr:flagellar hook-length control protein FliK [Acetobacteraceae bacterium]